MPIEGSPEPDKPETPTRRGGTTLPEAPQPLLVGSEDPTPPEGMPAIHRDPVIIGPASDEGPPSAELTARAVEAQTLLPDDRLSPAVEASLDAATAEALEKLDILEGESGRLRLVDALGFDGGKFPMLCAHLDALGAIVPFHLLLQGSEGRLVRHSLTLEARQSEKERTALEIWLSYLKRLEAIFQSVCELGLFKTLGAKSAKMTGTTARLTREADGPLTTVIKSEADIDDQQCQDLAQRFKERMNTGKIRSYVQYIVNLLLMTRNHPKSGPPYHQQRVELRPIEAIPVNGIEEVILTGKIIEHFPGVHMLFQIIDAPSGKKLQLGSPDAGLANTKILEQALSAGYAEVRQWRKTFGKTR
ncbi:MAG: hypothetical protein Q8P95_03360 [bacterium]|nr:hypothetical protein [bacterium]